MDFFEILKIMSYVVVGIIVLDVGLGLVNVILKTVVSSYLNRKR